MRTSKIISLVLSAAVALSVCCIPQIHAANYAYDSIKVFGGADTAEWSREWATIADTTIRQFTGTGEFNADPNYNPGGGKQLTSAPWIGFNTAENPVIKVWGNGIAYLTYTAPYDGVVSLSSDIIKAKAYVGYTPKETRYNVTKNGARVWPTDDHPKRVGDYRVFFPKNDGSEAAYYGGDYGALSFEGVTDLQVVAGDKIRFAVLAQQDETGGTYYIRWQPIVTYRSFSLNLSAVSLRTGDTAQLSPSFFLDTPAVAMREWSSSDENVAIVDENGKVYGVKEGECTVTVTTIDDQTASCAVTVTNEWITAYENADISDFIADNGWTSSSGAVSQSNAAASSCVLAGYEFKTHRVSFGAKPANADFDGFGADFRRKDADNKYTLWIEPGGVSLLKFTDGERVVLAARSMTIDNAIVHSYEMIADGAAITVKIDGATAITSEDNAYSIGGFGFTSNCAVTFSGLQITALKQALLSFGIESSEVSVEAADSKRLKTRAVPEEYFDRRAVWNTDDNLIATVNGFGTVSGVTAGNTTVRAVKTVNGQDFASQCAVRVTPYIPMTGITVSRTSAFLFVGETCQLTAQTTPVSGTRQGVVWSSSNPAVATVSRSGAVTVVGEGTAEIIAKTVDPVALTAKCVITARVKTPADYALEAINAVTTATRDTMRQILIDHNGALELDLSKLPAVGTANMLSLAKALTQKDFKTTAEVKKVYNDTIANFGTGGGGGGGGGRGRGGDGRGSSTVTIPSGLGNVPIATPAPTPEPTPIPPKFDDVPKSHWAWESIETLADQGVVSGDGTGGFRPDDPVSREEFVKMAVTAFGLLDKSAKVSFDDVPPDAWFYTDVASAVKANVIYGLGEYTFGAGEEISRQDMAVMLYRIALKKGVMFKAGETPAVFSDAADIAEYAKKAVEVLRGAEIISGVGDNLFAPEQSSTRAMAVKVLHGLMRYREEGSGGI